MKGLFSVISCWRANLQLLSYIIKSALPKCGVRLLIRHFGVLVMTNHHASSYTVPPEIAVLFSYHSTVKLILRKLMSVHWFWMDLQSVDSLFQESKVTTTSTPMLLSNETFVTSTTEFPVSSLKIWPRAGFLAGAHYLQFQLTFWLVGILAIPQKMSSFSCQRVPGNCACKDCFEWRVCFVCLGLSY